MSKGVKLGIEEYIEILNIAIAATSLHDSLISIKRVNFTKDPKILIRSKDLIKSLRPIVDGIGQELFNASIQEMEAIVEVRSAMLREIAATRPEDWQMVAYAARWVNDPGSTQYHELMDMCIAFDKELRYQGFVL